MGVSGQSPEGQAGETLLDDLCRALNSPHEGCLSVLRHGFKSFGKLFRAAYFAPASGMNPDTQKLYAANRLTIHATGPLRQRTGNTLDVVLSLNGIPLATAELKNPMTAQTWRHAVTQYKNDRDPADLIFQFKKRALVHFAVDPDEVYMTTRLSGRSTHFLPFNKGRGNGAGNPGQPEGYKTAYLWEEVLERDSFLDILARFIHSQVEEKKVGGKKVKRGDHDLPRYHQLDCVRQLVADAASRAPGPTTWSSIPPAAARATPLPGWRTAWPACTTTRTSRSSIPSSWSPTGGARSAAAEHHLPVRAQAGRGAEDRR